MERVLWFWLTTCLLPCPGAALVLFSPSITWNPIAPASPILRRCFLEFFITAYHIDRSSLVTLLSKPYLYFKRNYWTISQACLCLSYSHQQWGYLCPNSVRVGVVDCRPLLPIRVMVTGLTMAVSSQGVTVIRLAAATRAFWGPLSAPEQTWSTIFKLLTEF